MTTERPKKLRQKKEKESINHFLRRFKDHLSYEAMEFEETIDFHEYDDVLDFISSHPRVNARLFISKMGVVDVMVKLVIPKYYGEPVVQ